MSLTVSISIDAIGREVMHIPAKAANALRTMNGAGRACAEGALPVYENNFRRLSGSNRNKFGARGGFWNRMLAGTKAGGSNSEGFIRMPLEVGARRYGTTVTPKKAKYLALPARTEAYGKSPRQFDDLRFIPFRGKPGGMLVKSEDASPSGNRRRARRIGGGKGSVGQTFYFLVPKAVILPDTSVLPTDAEVQEGAVRGAVGWLQLQIRRGGRA